MSEPGTACGVCGHYACVCTIRARHKPDCKFLKAAAGSVPIECEHGHDVCAKCDPCTCGSEVVAEDLGSPVLLDRWRSR